MLKYYDAPNKEIEKPIFNTIFILPISTNFPIGKIAISRDDIVTNEIVYLGYIEEIKEK